MFSLPDWAFYPLAAAVTAGMVAGAMSFGESQHRTPEEILSEGLVFGGSGLATLQTGNGLTAEFLSEGDQAFVRLTAARGPFDGIQSAGAFFTLTPEERTALQGHRVRIHFTVRRSPENGAMGLRTNFFVPGVGQNGWARSELAEDFEVLTLDLSPPGCSWTYGYIGLWPDWTHEQNTIDLERIEFTALETNSNC